MSSRAVRGAAAIVAAALITALAATHAGATTRAQGRAVAASGGNSFKFSFSPNKPGVSTAMTFSISSTSQPTSITVALPPKTLLNLKSVPICGAPPTCDPSTQVGTGKAALLYTNASGTSYTIPLNFQIFNRAGGVAVVITVPNAAPVMILPTVSGMSLTIPYRDFTYNGLPIQVTKVSMSFFQLGSGKKALVRTPATCTKSGWHSTAALTYTTGTVNLKATAKCQVPKKKKKPKQK
jgi:hypothetical protein